jgi:glucose-1-phosphate adenylyltransferase
VLVEGGAAIDSSLVANGCVIAGRVERSILFAGVRVGPGAVVRDSVVMSDVTIEAGAKVERAILDKYGRIGEGAVVGDGDDDGPSDLHWLGGLVLVGKDAWIPPGGRVQRPASIGVGGRYEDFVDGVLTPGSVVGNRRWFEELR